MQLKHSLSSGTHLSSAMLRLRQLNVPLQMGCCIHRRMPTSKDPLQYVALRNTCSCSPSWLHSGSNLTPSAVLNKARCSSTGHGTHTAMIGLRGQDDSSEVMQCVNTQGRLLHVVVFRCCAPPRVRLLHTSGLIWPRLAFHYIYVLVLRCP